ncbi:unnamed protein product [Schistosoma margrebowiei]|uniref:Uncharacterized protein n=1 Tax=Schistosoma margrebowiei TaxID=48269 RepID=A0A183MEC5_9TREM|nr:unnamed protein product [Schistosoma margrebowiei]
MLLSTHSVNILFSNVWHTYGLKPGCHGCFWFLGSPWFRPTSAACSGPIPYERNLQILDTNHSGVVCQLEQQIQHTSAGTVLRKRPSLAAQGSMIASCSANPLVLQSHVCRSAPRIKPLLIECVDPL